MKAPISTALSMAAILATGGAALAVNATVMNPQAATSPSSSDAPSGPAEANPSLGANEFQIPGVGLVTLMTIGDKLVLESVAVNDGFTYVIRESSPGHFDIRFESADRVVTFTARLADGQIITSATSMNTSAGAPAAPVAPAPAPASAGGAAPDAGGGVAPGSDFSADDGYDDHNEYEFEHEDDDHDEGHDDDHDDD